MTAGRRESFFKRIESWAFHTYWNRISSMSLDEASNAGAALARTLGPTTTADNTPGHTIRPAFPLIPPA